MRFTLALMILILAFVLQTTGCAPADTDGDDIGDDRQPVTGPAESEQPDEPIGGTGASGGEVPVETSPDDETDGYPAPDSGVISMTGFPDGWPGEVGVPPGFTVTSGIRYTETSSSVSAEGLAGVEETGEFYQEIEGWERMGETNTGGEGTQAPLMKAIRFMKDQLMLDVHIIGEEGITKLHLNLDEIPDE